MAVILVAELKSVAHPGDTVLTQIAAAVDKQVHQDLCPAWGREPWHVEYAPGGSPAQPNSDGHYDVVAHLVDSDANVPGALAYHDDPSGIPDIYVLAGTILSQPGGSWTSGPGAVSVGFSHEVCELIVDPYCAGATFSADGSKAVAQEVCDPVEGHAYDVDGVTVSDFVLPGYFNVTDASGHPSDYLGVLHAPLAIDSGYQIVWTGIGQPSQVTGELPPDHGQRGLRRGLVIPGGHAFSAVGR